MTMTTPMMSKKEGQKNVVFGPPTDYGFLHVFRSQFRSHRSQYTAGALM